MATAADELLNDFENSEDEQGGDVLLVEEESGENGMEVDDENQTAPPNPADAAAEVEKMRFHHVSDVRSVATLMKQLQPVINEVQSYKNLPPDEQMRNIGNVDSNPEYKLLTQSNTLATQIDGEIMLLHKFIRDHYSVRFPELETLIRNPLDYAKAVAILGDGPMDNIRQLSESKDNIVGQSLRQVLDGPSLMVVTIEASQTRGESLPPKELETIQRACQMVLDLDRGKKILTDYVQSRMSVFAPNLTTLIGSETAAQLLSYAGGISGLAKTPACNLAPLGSKKDAAATGLATNVGVRHQGFLYHNAIIKQVPTDLKKSAMRILAAKVVLAARIDQSREFPAGEEGLALYEQVETRIAKLSQAPPNQGVRALRAPDDKPARKRGGRQARKAKAAVAMTELRKAQNRVAFGEAEAEVDYGDTSKGLGMMGSKQDGRVRALQVDQRTRAKLSKKNPGWGGTSTQVAGTATSFRSASGMPLSAFKASGLRTMGVGSSGLKTQVAGTTSSLAFTPVQGIELVDPRVREERERKQKAEEDKYFSSGTFTQVGVKRDAQGFTVPGLPASKTRKVG
ncbi:Nop domain-containing protein [Piedraia hortae CBS 480.64]|uniref:Nop domain-containing protein n=1 Tax=Piedraia hortae CBS 480.64 TaxID=1314780 RepID=A0A6A7BW27_9PEZI|nr:Nop domain-containing protein [Piedraia hortae CBS 480.64]